MAAWDRQYWQNKDAATSPAGAIIMSYEGRRRQQPGDWAQDPSKWKTTLYAQQRTDNKGIEGSGIFKQVTAAELLDHGYQKISPPPHFGATIRDPEGKDWRVGGFVGPNQRRLSKPNVQNAEIMDQHLTLNEIIGWTMVETYDERLLREGEERAAKLEKAAKELEEMRRKSAKPLGKPTKQEALL